MTDESKFEPGHGYTKEDWDAVDSPEITDEEFGKGLPFTEVFPKHAASIRRRGKQTAAIKELVSIRISSAVLEKFRALGPGWQKRMNAVLEDAAAKL